MGKHKFELVKTSLPFKTYRVSKTILLHDARERKKVSQDEIVDAALEAFGKSGSLRKQLKNNRSKGLLLQTDKLHHYCMLSIDEKIYVSSTKVLSPEQTRPITNEYIEEDDEDVWPSDNPEDKPYCNEY